MLEGQRVARGATRGAEEHRHARQRAVLDHVEEELEQAAVRGVEDRADGNQAIGTEDGVHRVLERGRWHVREQLADEVLGVLAQLDRSALDTDAGAAQLVLGRSRQAIGEQPGGRRLREAGADDHQRSRSGHRSTPPPRAAGRWPEAVRPRQRRARPSGWHASVGRMGCRPAACARTRAA